MFAIPFASPSVPVQEPGSKNLPLRFGADRNLPSIKDYFANEPDVLQSLATFKTLTEDRFTPTCATAATQQPPTSNMGYHTPCAAPTSDATQEQGADHSLPSAKRQRTSFIPDGQQASRAQEQGHPKPTPSEKYNDYNDYLEMAIDFQQNGKPNKSERRIVNNKEIKGSTFYINYLKWLKNGEPEPEQFAAAMTAPKQKLTRADYEAMAAHFRQNDQIPDQTQLYQFNNKEIKGGTVYNAHRSWLSKGRLEPEPFGAAMTAPKQQFTRTDYQAMATHFRQNDQAPNTSERYTINDKEISGSTLYTNYQKWLKKGKPEPEQFADSFPRAL